MYVQCSGMVEVEEMECVWDDMIEHDFLDEWRKKLDINDDEILDEEVDYDKELRILLNILEDNKNDNHWYGQDHGDIGDRSERCRGSVMDVNTVATTLKELGL